MLALVIKLVTSVLLIFIIVEDFKHRAVRWWFFPLLGLTLIGIEYRQFSVEVVLLNCCFILIQLAMLSLYFSIKEKKLVNITKNYLGWGDIVFWMVISLLFSTLNFILFTMVSLLFVMFILLVVHMVKNNNSLKIIPLAGLQAIALLVVLIGTVLSDKVLFRNDSWLESIITQ